MNCKYNHKEFCANDKCPMRGDYCPVPDIEGVCRYEDRCVFTFEDCYELALRRHGVHPDVINKSLKDLYEIMIVHDLLKMEE